MAVRIALCLLALAATFSPANAALFEGKDVGVEYYFPDLSSVYNDLGTSTISGPTTFGPLADGHGFLTISDTKLLASFTTTTSWTGSDFNGFVVSDLNNTISDFTSVSINPETLFAGFDESRLSFDANNIYVNWQGLDFSPDNVLSLQVTGAVPEPATWAMMIIGLGGVGGALRRRRKAQAPELAATA